MENLTPLFERNIRPVLETNDGISEYFRNLNTERTVERKEKLLYLMFENEQNNCWLDACIVLIANSKAFEDAVDGFQFSEIKAIITTYKKALTILNDSNGLIQERMDKTRKLLQGIQNKTLNYLEKFLKFKSGEPESAFCALLNLIYHDDSDIKQSMSVSWIWQKNCDNCGPSKPCPSKKPIITLPKVNEFKPESPTCVYTCSSCKKEQEMKLIYKELPNCLIFHFEKGVGTGNIPLSFMIDSREYHLTGVVLLEKSKANPLLNNPINHFVTFIRQPSVDMWLDCNDLNIKIVQYEKKQPKWDLSEIFICVYEANDNRGKINYMLPDSEQTEEVVDAELIYLSDEDASKPVENEATTSNQKEEIPLNSYLNNGDEQSKNDFYNELMGDNDEQGAFLNAPSHEMSGIEEICNLENINTIHRNVPLTDDQHALFEISFDVNCKTGLESENFANESVSLLDVPEFQTKNEEIHPENGISNALNQKSELPSVILDYKNIASEKSAGDSKLRDVPRNKANGLAEKSTENIIQKTEVKEDDRNSNLGKKEAQPKPKLSEASTSGARPRPGEPSANGTHPKPGEGNVKNKCTRPRLSEARARELENIIDTVTTNVFTNFMGFMCKEREKNNSKS